MAPDNRSIGIGMDYSPTSKAAAKWAVENLVKNGDRIILIHALPKGTDATQKELWKGTGSPLIPLTEFMEMNVPARYGVNPDKDILEMLEAESKDKQVIVLTPYGNSGHLAPTGSIKLFHDS